MLDVLNLNKKFSEKTIFDDASFSLPVSGLYFLDGDNGSGKTTLFNILSSFEEIDSGSITIFNEPLSNETYKKYIFYYNVDFNLVDYLTVKDNLSNFDNEEVAKLLKSFNVSDLLERKVFEISKGEKARIGIIKAFLYNKSILLLDEPFAYLDMKMSEQVYEKIKEYSKNHLVIFCDHYFRGYKNNDLRIMKIIDKKVEVESKTLNNDAHSADIKSQNLGKNTAKLTFFLFLKKKFRYILMLLTLILSSAVLFTSLNFSLTSKKDLYEQILDGNDVAMASIGKEDAFKYLDIDDENYFSFVNDGISVKKGNEFLNNNAYIYFTNNQSLTFDNVYTFTQNADSLPLIVSKNCADIFNLHVGDSLEISLNNTPSYLGNSFEANINAIIEEVNFDSQIFINTKAFFNHIKNLVFDVNPSACGLNQVKDELSLDFFNGCVLSFQGAFDNLLLANDNNEQLKNNEINLIIYSDYLEGFGQEEFENYFNTHVKNRTLNQVDPSEGFSLFDFYDNLIIKGYKVVDSKKVYPIIGSFGVEISQDFEDILEENLKDNSLFSWPEGSIIILRKNLSDIKAEDVSMLLRYTRYDGRSDVTYTDFTVLEAKDSFQWIFISISLFFLALSIMFFTISSIHLLKENSKNFYVLLKDSYNYKDLYLIFSVGQYILILLSLIIGLIVSLPVDSVLNTILESTTTLSFSISYFNFSGFNFLILLATFIFIFMIASFLFYFLVYRKKIVDLQRD